MDLTKLKPNIRYLAEIQELLFDQNWAKTASDLKLYFMYRDLSMNDKDRQIIEKAGLRYDITVMPFIILGQEYNKTAGHDHPLVPKTNMTYPEIYEVLAGQVIFLIQDSQGDNIKDVYAVEAKKDDKVIIPPNYEHLMINASDEEIKTANWICRDFGSNVYKPFREKHGFSYFAVKGPTNEIEWRKNLNYQDTPELRFQEPNHWLNKFKIDKNKEMYSLLKELKKLDFLKTPQDFEWK